MSDLNELLKNLVDAKDGNAKESVVKAFVTTSVADDNTKLAKVIKSEQAIVERKVVSGRPQYVSVEYGATIPIGNYVMAKVRVSVSSPVGVEFTPEVTKAINDQIESCRKIAEEFVSKEIKELKKTT